MVHLDDELRKDLESNFILVKKGKLFHVIGGALAVLVAIGFVSYKGAMVAVESHAGVIAAEEIQRHLENARRDSAAIAARLTSVPIVDGDTVYLQTHSRLVTINQNGQFSLGDRDKVNSPEDDQHLHIRRLAK